MVVTGYVAALIFGVFAHLMHRRGWYWGARLVDGLAFLSIAGTWFGGWLHDHSSEGLNLALAFIISLFHK